MERAAALRLGCPVWACTAWRGSLFTRRASRDDYLPQYASVFDAVEGNSTFYGLPTEATVARWREQVPAHFRFCFKFPQVVTHRMLLRYADAETSEFLFLLEPLRDRLGPLLLQLPPNFGAADLHVLTHYLDGLPNGFEYAVEVRHPEFFDGGAFESALDDALRERSVARVSFDATCLFEDPALDDATRDAIRRKPRLPLRHTATNATPVVRFVGRNDPEPCRDALRGWAEVVARWIAEGRSPYFFTHAPDDAHAPALARVAHACFAERVAGLAALPPFPGEHEAPVASGAEEMPRQSELF
ncbi:MAG TPA: DUF72 domain-containing protein [Xanthomonadales bacterium]|nr:DUF72 domain-containing protein [Xanthomonadales bacterium]